MAVLPCEKEEGMPLAGEGKDELRSTACEIGRNLQLRLENCAKGWLMSPLHTSDYHLLSDVFSIGMVVRGAQGECVS